MGIGFKGFIGAVTLVASSTVIPAVALAQDAGQVPPAPVEVISVSEAVEEEFFDESGTFFQNRSIPRQVDTLFLSFPELEIERDAEDVHELYEELLALQTMSDPILRVPDLTNPYQSSILLLPSSQVGSRAVGTELRFERQPVVVPANPPALW